MPGQGLKRPGYNSFKFILGFFCFSTVIRLFKG